MRPQVTPGVPASLLALAATALGVAIQIDDGEYHPTPGGAAAIALITLAIAAAGIAVAGLKRACAFFPLPVLQGKGGRALFDRFRSIRPAPPPSPGVPREGTVPADSHVFGTLIGEKNVPAGRPAIATLAVLLAMQFAILLFSRPDSAEQSYLKPAGLASLNVYRAGVALAAVVAVVGICTALRAAAGPRSAGIWLATSIVVFVSLAAWSLTRTSVPHSDVHPRIDVFLFQQKGARTLSQGGNPYAIDDFPDIYADPVTGKARQEVYGPGMSDGHVLHFGFPYLPASLYLATLGYWATGDFRAAQVAALSMSAALIYFTRPGWTSALAAGLLLFTPRAFFILISGWTEPFLVLWMSAAIYCACRRPRLLPIALGLLLATKQYMALAVLPATVLLVSGTGERAGAAGTFARWRDYLKLPAIAGLVAFVVSAPLAFWDLKKFYFSVVTVQKYAPFRWDALSFLTWHAFGHGEPSAVTTMILPGVMAFAAIALSLWRAPRTPAGFAASVGLILLVFFAFSKQAFANYYFFAIGALCCAIAASPLPVERFAPMEAPPTPGESGANGLPGFDPIRLGLRERSDQWRPLE